MSGFKPNISQTARLIAAAENGRADDQLDDFQRFHDANNGTCPGKCCNS
jgi:hypothetical protein